MGGEADPDLFLVVAALDATGRFAHALDCGKQERDQKPDDRDHDQKLDKREGAMCSPTA